MNHRLRQLLLIVLILGGSTLLTYKLATQKHPVKHSEHKVQLPVVRTVLCQPIDKRVFITSYGLVKPTVEFALQPEVGARIIALSPNLIPGSTITKGEMLLSLDPSDFTAMLKNAEADYARAELDFITEEGRRQIAERDWKTLHKDLQKGDLAATLNSKLSQDLALRRPQAKEKKAALEAAQSRLEKAKNDLKRTTLTAPFSGMVLEENVSLGQSIAPMQRVGTLVPTDRFWIETHLAVEQLKWIEQNGESVVQIHHNDHIRTGKLLKVLSSVTEQGRMARLLVAVDDPLDLASPNTERHPLLLGACVQTEISGILLENVYPIPRSALRDGNTVWLMDPTNTLSICSVTLIYSDADHYYVKGLDPGDQLITNRLALPIAGMPLKSFDESSDEC